MRIGIVPILGSSSSGIYRYSLTMLRALYRCKGEGCKDEFIVFADDIHPLILALVTALGWVVKRSYASSLRLAANLARPFFGDRI